jgi:phage tail sheath gpL-like
MEQDSLKGAPLVPDKDVVTSPVAIQPKAVKTMFINLADSLALAAIISDADFTKKNLTVKIDSENPKRLNVVFPVKLSGNIEVSNTDIYFGFYLGGE